MFTNKIRYNIYDTDISVLYKLFNVDNAVFEFKVMGKRMLGSLHLTVSSIDPHRLCDEKICEDVLARVAVTETEDTVDICNVKHAINIIKIDDDLALKIADYIFEGDKPYQKDLDSILKMYTDAGHSIQGITDELPDDIDALSYYGNIDIECMYKMLTNKSRVKLLKPGYSNDSFKIDEPTAKSKLFMNYVFNRKNTMQKELYGRYCAYAIDDEYNLGELYIKDRLYIDDIDPEIIYYPDLRIYTGTGEEVHHSIVGACNGIDVLSRDYPTMIFDDIYLEGITSEFKGDESGAFWYSRDSSMHSGLFSSYMFQSPSSVQIEGYKRNMVEDAIDECDNRVCFGEVVDGVHIFKIFKEYAEANSLVSMSASEIKQYFVDIIGDKPMLMMVYINTNIEINEYGNWLVIQNKENIMNIIRKGEENGLHK